MGARERENHEDMVLVSRDRRRQAVERQAVQVDVTDARAQIFDDKAVLRLHLERLAEELIALEEETGSEPKGPWTVFNFVIPTVHPSFYMGLRCDKKGKYLPAIFAGNFISFQLSPRLP